MTAPRQWRIVPEPGALVPWIVQVATVSVDAWWGFDEDDAVGEGWLDWRRFHDEADARRYIAAASSPRRRREAAR